MGGRYCHSFYDQIYGRTCGLCRRRNCRQRAITDFEYELQMAQTNRVIAPDVDTIFLTTNLKYSYLSSSIVKEIAYYNGDIREFLHPEVAGLVQEKIAESHINS